MAGALEGMGAVVTGASRGIGAVIARRFAEEGATVVVTARTVETPAAGGLPGTLTETAEAIRAAGGRAIAVPADLSRPADRQRLAAEAERALGEIDILVSNAAVTYFTPVMNFTPKRYDLMFEVQVVGPFHLAQLAVPGMRDKGAGWILNISSGAARHPAIPPNAFAGRGGTVYGMCKAALERFSTGLAAELYNDNIAVNALSPSRVVPTPGTVFHHLTTYDSPNAEPTSVMAEAALQLCSAEPKARTGMVTYSQQLLGELGVAIPGPSAR